MRRRRLSTKTTRTDRDIRAGPAPLTRAIRAALSPRSAAIGAGLLAAGLAGVAPPAAAALFSAEFELSSLASGDGSIGFVLNGVSAFDYAGSTVSAAGDVNGDGVDDLILSAYRATPAARTFAGESYVVFGVDTAQAGRFPAQVELSSLATGDGSTGFVLNGIDAHDSSGSSVSGAGDVNGDGVDDVIVGAWSAGASVIGECYVVFGRDTGQTGNFPSEFELSSLLTANGGDGSEGFVLLPGADTGGRLGRSVSAAGDVNGDGLDDVIVGAYSADPDGRADAGQGYVVFGRNTVLGGDFPAEFDLSSLLAGNGGDGSTGFVLNGIDASDVAGSPVGAVGDVNGDDLDDLIISAPGGDPAGRTNAGETYVVFGRDTSLSGNFPPEFELASLATGDGSTGFVLNGIQSGTNSGRSVNAAGDANGDGVGDLIVGAPLAWQSYLVFGRDTAVAGNFPAEFELSSLLAVNGGDGSTGVVFSGPRESGLAVSSAGDINGDELDDVMVSTRWAETSTGVTHVVYGRDTAQSGDFPAEFDLATLAIGDGSTGFALNGIDAGDWSGWSVSAVGDVNADGSSDLIVGAKYATPDVRTKAGESYVVFGREDPDGDGLHNAEDNCTAVSNADQRDSNGDGFGNVCDTDLNNDCITNAVDLGLLKLVFFTTDADADFDGNGVVNVVDLGAMKLGFFQVPGPSGVTSDCN